VPLAFGAFISVSHAMGGEGRKDAQRAISPSRKGRRDLLKVF